MVQLYWAWMMKGSRMKLTRNAAIVSPGSFTCVISPDSYWLIPRSLSSTWRLTLWPARLSGTKLWGAGPEKRTREVLLGEMP